MRADEVVGELIRAQLYRVEEAKGPNGPPAALGFYAWWATAGALPEVPVTEHPSASLGLLYVGIAPRSATSTARLRSRLCGQHIGGNVASSTFRFGLASMLWQRERWIPRRSSSGKYRLDAHDNAALSAWQRDHLRLQWLVIDAPWLLEADVIRAMKPPMNREHNQRHAFYSRMGDARDSFRAAAKSS